MAKQKSKASGAGDAASGHLVRVLTINILVAGILLGAGIWGFRRLEKHVETRLACPSKPPTVVLKSRPVWMWDDLNRQILDSVRPRHASSAMDVALLKTIEEKLRANAWVRKVHYVRRVYGQSAADTIEIDCDFRAPVALVAWKDSYLLVDGEGVRLPKQYSSSELKNAMLAANGRVELRVVEGVAEEPPREFGKQWRGADLAAGLDMVKMLYGVDAAEDIYRVNVRNFGGRVKAKDAHLVLVTKYHSEIRWGKPIRDPFPEVPPTVKLDRLARIKQQFKGRVDAGYSWIDIRLDQIECPREEQPDMHASASE